MRVDPNVQVHNAVSMDKHLLADSQSLTTEQLGPMSEFQGEEASQTQPNSDNGQ